MQSYAVYFLEIVTNVTQENNFYYPYKVLMTK
jgi:hypothetical protein